MKMAPECVCVGTHDFCSYARHWNSLYYFLTSVSKRTGYSASSNLTIAIHLHKL